MKADRGIALQFITIRRESFTKITILAAEVFYRALSTDYILSWNFFWQKIFTLYLFKIYCSRLFFVCFWFVNLLASFKLYKIAQFQSVFYSVVDQHSRTICSCVIQIFFIDGKNVSTLIRHLIFYIKSLLTEKQQPLRVQPAEKLLQFTSFLDPRTLKNIYLKISCFFENKLNF